MAGKITINSFVESLTRHFPGCIPLAGDKIGGQTASITLWEFYLHGTLTTSKVSHSDTSDEITIGFWQKEEDRARRPLKRRTLSTTDPDEMEAFIQWCADWVTGVLHVLTIAFEERSDTVTEIEPGLEGLLAQGNQAE